MDSNEEDSEYECFYDSSSSSDDGILRELRDKAMRGEEILPYQYEPYLSDVHSDEPNSESDSEHEEEFEDAECQGAAGNSSISMDSGRLKNVDWCSCGKCTTMETVEESICCREQQKVSKRREQQPGIQCITEHRGFEPVCLNEDVLITAHYAYQERYEDDLGKDWKRSMSCRQFIQWCYRYLGRRIRVPLPSCAATTIRATFPSLDHNSDK